MTLLERIKEVGGIADFAMVNSTPWAVLNSNELLTGGQYAEFKQLVASGELKASGKADPKKWSSSAWLKYEGDFYK